MPISSYVVRFLPGERTRVSEALRAVPGVELGEATDSGLAVVADTRTTRAAEEMGDRLLQVPGVSSAVLVYHNFEDLADPAETPVALRADQTTHDA